MSLLRRHITIPFFDRLAGDRRLEFLEELNNEFSSRSQKELDSLQVERFWKIARAAYINCPFYKELYYQAGVNPLQLKSRDDINKIPIISKNDIYNHMNRMLNRSYDPSSLRKSATGGTTAAPMAFYLTYDAWSRRRAATLYFKNWFGYIPGDRQAFLWGAPQDFPGGINWKWRLKNFLTENSLMMFSSYLNDDIMRNFCHSLQQFKPVTLQAYSTPLAILAEYMLENKISLSIPGVNVTAEPLYDHQRKVIEKAFNTKAFNWYGARELGHIATECRAHNGLHINTWGILLETVANGQSVWDKAGDFVVTELYNDGMPLIRYRIGDLGIITRNACSCGFPTPRIQEILGRVGDVFRKRDGTRIPGISFADRVLTDSRSIAHLQVIQKDFELFELVIVKGTEYSDLTIGELKTTISNYLKLELQFIITFVDSIPREASGKIRFIKNEMPA